VTAGRVEGFAPVCVESITRAAGLAIATRSIMIHYVFLLICALAGFVLGAVVIGSLDGLRARPRYLMATGAAIMPIVWATHPLLHGLNTHFADIMILMAGVGLVVAGWDAEAEMERARRLDDLRRLRAAWDKRSADTVPDIADQDQPLATFTDAVEHPVRPHPQRADI
jgi:hypothetical protein